ncbi:MAG: undecaprenyl-diphosphate phosphatase [Candidatus Omnitrophota bacterium]
MKFIFLGIVQGLTEFLPISSSGHLYLLQKLLVIKEDYLSFFVFLHLATLLAIIVFFVKQIRLLSQPKLLLNILLITLISGLMGLGIQFYLSSFFGTRFLLAFCFLINAGILLSVRPGSSKRSIESISLKDSFFLGFLQGISPFPGISRAGITIVGALRRGFKPIDAFSLSFLMAIPLILGAFVVEFKALGEFELAVSSLGLGFIAAFAFGLLALKIVKRALVSAKFKNFAYYCLLMALVTLIV